jgi:hypothetical protein
MTGHPLHAQPGPADQQHRTRPVGSYVDIHVDIRAFVTRRGVGRFPSAVTTFAETVRHIGLEIQHGNTS